MGSSRSRWRVTLAAWVLGCHLVAITCSGLVPAAALAQTPASKAPVERGQQYYEQARFDEAITLLKDLVDRNALSGEDLRKARELLARSYVKKGYPVLGKDMFKDILRQEPDWRPDPIRVPPDETAVFEQALREFQSEQQPPPPTPAPVMPAPADTAGVVQKSTETLPPPEPSEKKSVLSKWWLWAATAGAVAAIALVAGGGGGDGDGEDLPGFPPPPP
jgi:hypothetical protein